MTHFYEAAFKYYLTGLLLHYWKMSDQLAQLRPYNGDREDYKAQIPRVIRAATNVKHEASIRFLDRKHTIPFPWVNDETLE